MLCAGRQPRELVEVLGVSEQTLRSMRHDTGDRGECDDGLDLRLTRHANAGATSAWLVASRASTVASLCIALLSAATCRISGTELSGQGSCPGS